MANFMSSYDDATETAGIFNDCNTVYFFEALIHDTGSANVCKSYGWLNENDLKAIVIFIGHVKHKAMTDV